MNRYLLKLGDADWREVSQQDWIEAAGFTPGKTTTFDNGNIKGRIDTNAMQTEPDWARVNHWMR